MRKKAMVAVYLAGLVVLAVLRPCKRLTDDAPPAPVPVPAPVPPRELDAGVVPPLPAVVEVDVPAPPSFIDAAVAVDAAVVDVTGVDAGPPSAFERLAREALTPDDFDRLLDGNEWAFFPHGVRPCEAGEDVRFTTPGATEFDRRENEQRRAGLTATLAGRLVVFRATGSLGVGDGEGLDVEHRFELVRSEYDFLRHAYPMALVAGRRGSGDDGDAVWPICERGRCRPQFRRGSTAEGDDPGPWQNASRLPLSVALPEARARGFATDMPVNLSLVMRFQGLGFDQRCERTCEGEGEDRECTREDQGFGLFYEAELVAYELRIGGEVALSRLPATPARSRGR